MFVVNEYFNPIASPEIFRRCRIAAMLLLLGVSQSIDAQQEGADSADRLKELRFGQVLYEYFQNKPLASLEAAELADYYGYPDEHSGRMQLIKGGAHLQLGMTRSATENLTQLLAQTQPPDIQAQAWYWLAKTAFQQGMYKVSAQASSNLQSPELLEYIGADQRHEMAYQSAFYRLQQQPDAWQSILSEVSPNTKWYPYLVANAAIQAFNQQQYERASGLFVDAIQSLQVTPDDSWQWSLEWLSWFDPRQWFEEQEQVVTPIDVQAREQNALLDRLYLGLGRSFVQQQNYNAAFNALKQVQADSLYAEQGLLAYGWALARDERWSEAMPVWQYLHRQGKGLAALQATHALAYGFERLGDYQRAFSMLGESLQQLQLARTELSALNQSANDASFFVQLASDSSAVKQQWPSLHHDLLVDVLSGDNQADSANQLASILQMHGTASLITNKLSILDHMRQLLEERELAQKARAEGLQLEQAQQTLDEANLALQTYSAKVEQAKEQPDLFATATQNQLLQRLEAVLAGLHRLDENGEVSAQRKMLLRARYERLKGLLEWQLAEQQIVQQHAHEQVLSETRTALEQAQQQFESLQDVNRDQLSLNQQWQADRQRVETLRERYSQKQQQVDRILASLAQRLSDYLKRQIAQRDAVLLEQVTATQLAMLRMQDRQLTQPLSNMAGGQ